MSELQLVKVAVLMPATYSPRDLSKLLDIAFMDVDWVFQFTVEGHGWEPGTEPTEESLLAGAVEGTADLLLTRRGRQSRENRENGVLRTPGMLQRCGLGVVSKTTSARNPHGHPNLVLVRVVLHGSQRSQTRMNGQ